MLIKNIEKTLAKSKEIKTVFTGKGLAKTKQDFPEKHYSSKRDTPEATYRAV